MAACTKRAEEVLPSGEAPSRRGRLRMNFAFSGEPIGSPARRAAYGADHRQAAAEGSGHQFARQRILQALGQTVKLLIALEADSPIVLENQLDVS